MNNLTPQQDCKGSWYHSARNIRYNGNTLKCELRSIDGKWIPNELRFFNQYEYANINGRFEWNNCKNWVEFNNITHDHISRRYKPVSIQTCLNNLNNDYNEWFEIEKEHIHCIKYKCLSVSLFQKNSNNRYEDEYNVDVDKWTKKYYNSLINNLNNYNFGNMCVNLYLSNDLSGYIPELSKYTFLNIFLMKSKSIGAQPGTLWRFMDFSNQSYKTVFVADVDENWNWVREWDVNNYDCKVCTLAPRDGIICNNPYIPAYNFATIIASHVMVNPRKFDYNITDVMKGFINIRKNRENSNNPCCFDDDDQITLWNQPVGDHKFGWGSIITAYGFDELFLKHVIYYDAFPDFKFI
jgi:hypothetical protein